MGDSANGHVKTLVMAALVAGLTTLVVIYLQPRVYERWEAMGADFTSAEGVVFDRSCIAARTFDVGGQAATIIRQAQTPYKLPRNAKDLPELGLQLAVEKPGVVELNLRLEAAHRGDGYSKVVGYGANITYQHAADADGLASAPVVAPAGWLTAENIRDLRHHYGQVQIVGAIPVEPGFYRFCVWGSSFSGLTDRDELVELIVDNGYPRNTLRLSYRPGAVYMD